MSIVDELRERGQDEDLPGSVALLCDDAADLIETLQKRVDELTTSGYRLSGLAFEAKRQRDGVAGRAERLENFANAARSIAAAYTVSHPGIGALVQALVELDRTVDNGEG